MRNVYKVRGIALWFVAVIMALLFGLCVWQNQVIRRLEAGTTVQKRLVAAPQKRLNIGVAYVCSGHLRDTFGKRIIFARGVYPVPHTKVKGAR